MSRCGRHRDLLEKDTSPSCSSKKTCKLYILTLQRETSPNFQGVPLRYWREKSLHVLRRLPWEIHFDFKTVFLHQLCKAIVCDQIMAREERRHWRIMFLNDATSEWILHPTRCTDISNLCLLEVGKQHLNWNWAKFHS